MNILKYQYNFVDTLDNLIQNDDVLSKASKSVEKLYVTMFFCYQKPSKKWFEEISTLVSPEEGSYETFCRDLVGIQQEFAENPDKPLLHQRYFITNCWLELYKLLGSKCFCLLLKSFDIFRRTETKVIFQISGDSVSRRRQQAIDV